MDIQKYILLSQSQNFLKSQFISGLETANGAFVDKPKSLNKTARLKRTALPEFKEYSKQVLNELIERQQMFISLGVGDVDAADYATKSALYEYQLYEAGAVYGQEPYNFCLDKIKFNKNILERIDDVALDGYQKVTGMVCPTASQSGSFLEDLNLRPNGARVDIILTEEGPRIIEINFQWVDGIQALDGLCDVLGNKKAQTASETLISAFPGKRLGLLYLSSGHGSRSSGEIVSLQIMAEKIRQKNKFQVVEILEPEKLRLSYLDPFDSFYLDGDPKMVNAKEVPDWLSLIYKKLNTGQCKVFPVWNPGYDRKSTLSIAYSNWPELFCPTYDFSEEKLTEFVDFCAVVKGDGFSSRQVAIAGTPLYENVLQDALLFPNEYVIQPKLIPIRIPPVLAFDTSSKRPKIIANPQSKFNVWIIEGKVAGTMLSVSENEIISDKDFNTIPLAI